MRGCIVLLGIAGACSGAAAPTAGPGTGAPAGIAVGADAGDRLDQAVTRWLAELDRATSAVSRGPRLDPGVRIRLPVTADGSPPVAPVSLTYFFELACPFCHDSRDMIDQLRARYGDRLAIIPRVMIVHRVRAMGAHLVECAAARLGHRVIDGIWDHAFSPDDFSGANLLSIAATGGAPAADVLAEIDAGRCFAAIRDDQLLALGAGVRGTPTYFINGIPIEGMAALDDLVPVIDAELARANAVVTQGGTLAAYHTAWQAAARPLRR